MYIDLLDSTKSGHPYASGKKEDWWRSNSRQQQMEAVSVAQASMLMRFLYGDTIVLSNNQAIDSYAWLSASHNLLSKYDGSYNLPVTWTSFKIDGKFIENPQPEDFLRTVIDTFRPKESDPSHFVLSAWSGLDNKLREKIAQNLETYQSFDNMFKDVYTSIDSSLQPIYEEQRVALDTLYSYLKKYHKGRINWLPEAPTVIKKNEVNPPLQISIWNSLYKFRDKDQGFQGYLLDEMEKKILFNKDRLESRSALYLSISDFESETRDRIRKLIDLLYNLKTGNSVTGGKGLFSILDHDPTTNFYEDFEMLDSVDDVINDLQISNNEAFFFIADEFKELSTLSYDDCVNLFKGNKNFQDSLHHLRNTMLSYPAKTKGNISDWQKMMNEALDKHEEVLANELKGKVKLKNGKLISFIPAAALLTGNLMIAGSFVATLSGMNLPLNDIVDGVGAMISIGASLGAVVGKKLNLPKLPTTASARLKTKFHKSTLRTL